MNLEEKQARRQRMGLRAGMMLPLSRREFGRIALAALPAASIVTVARQLGAAEAPTKAGGKPNSKVGGVHRSPAHRNRSIGQNVADPIAASRAALASS